MEAYLDITNDSMPMFKFLSRNNELSDRCKNVPRAHQLLELFLFRRYHFLKCFFECLLECQFGDNSIYGKNLTLVDASLLEEVEEVIFLEKDFANEQRASIANWLSNSLNGQFAEGSKST
jgi:hypothetical protein